MTSLFLSRVCCLFPLLIVARDDTPSERARTSIASSWTRAHYRCAIPSIAAARRGHRATERRGCVLHCRLRSGRCRRAGRGDCALHCAHVYSRSISFLPLLPESPLRFFTHVIYAVLSIDRHAPLLRLSCPHASGFLRRTGSLGAR